MLAHTILEANPNYQRFFVSEKETITENDIKELLLEKNSLIVFDSQSLDDRGFNSLLSNFDSERNNIVCVFLNSFDDVVNLITFHSKSINYAIKDTLRGKMPQDDILAINDKLNTLGISKFDQKRNLLDNTLRIANVYNRSDSVLSSPAMKTHASYEYDAGEKRMKPFDHLRILRGLLAVGEESPVYHVRPREPADTRRSHGMH